MLASKRTRIIHSFSSIWVLSKRTVTDRKQGIATEEGTRNIFGKQRPEQQISLQVPRNELQSINRDGKHFVNGDRLEKRSIRPGVT